MRKEKWEKLLKLRKAEERLKMQELGAIVRDIGRTNEQLIKIEKERTRVLSRQSTDKPDKLVAKREWLRGLYLNFLWDEQKRLTLSLEKFEREAEKKRVEVVEASQRRSIAETLCNIEVTKFRKKLEKQDALEVGEFVDRSSMTISEKRA